MPRYLVISGLAWGLMAGAAPAVLLESTPERLLFQGAPQEHPELTVRIVRRKESYGLYAYRTTSPRRRHLSRESFVGLAEGSLGGVGLESRAIAFLVPWSSSAKALPRPQRIGPYYRYRFEGTEWLLALTLERPYRPTPERPQPGGIVSQLFARQEYVPALEALTRKIDAEGLRLLDRSGLRTLARPDVSNGPRR